MSDHIRKAWTSYRERVVPVDASVVQVEQTRMAFYAGVAHLWNLLTGKLDAGGILTEGPDVDAGSMASMDGLQEEIQAFLVEITENAVRDLKGGR